MKIFIKKVFSCFAFFKREGIKFSDFWNERLFQVDFMVIGSGGGNVVGGFFRED